MFVEQHDEPDAGVISIVAGPSTTIRVEDAPSTTVACPASEQQQVLDRSSTGWLVTMETSIDFDICRNMSAVEFYRIF
ncbi:hypothetical protein HUN08_12750 [Gordonia sp. X0973]|uniref:hypothetical protein n=1 Tax=Gordonia sp. X0973 TaxID=2742602 RepID=UPI000F53B028|nr:hypothetical protein [Gordonia sp. X0973]QKT07958.1 hypothetical protein HUN08_12750 [Gordonia sp. X0973]